LRTTTLLQKSSYVAWRPTLSWRPEALRTLYKQCD